MERYIKHHVQILNEPITIWANPTYLPKEIEHLYDKLWTEERMRTLIALAVKNNIAIEIQAESVYPRPKFLKLAKQMYVDRIVGVSLIFCASAFLIH